jgi:hypothetical protein
MSATGKTPGPDTPEEIEDVVRHTDSGAGASQAEHWPPNQSGPDDVEEAKPAAPDKPFKDTGSI